MSDLHQAEGGTLIQATPSLYARRIRAALTAFAGELASERRRIGTLALSIGAPRACDERAASPGTPMAANNATDERELGEFFERVFAVFGVASNRPGDSLPFDRVPAVSLSSADGAQPRAEGLAARSASPSEARQTLPDVVEVRIDTNNLTDEHKKLLSIRFSGLSAESYEDFVSGFKKWLSATASAPQTLAHIDAFLRSRGVSQQDGVGQTYEQSFDLLLADPLYAIQTRLTASSQHVMWDRAKRYFHGDPDRFIAAMEKTDAAGPGTLELNPDMAVPDYCRYEIHAQPGGFVGDPFAGWIYHYGVTKGYRAGSAFHDENHLDYAMGHQMPSDGRVLRVLDLGCGTGQSTTALKMRFPNAEVWGIDVSGPLVRYAHYRAVNMNLDVNFAQRLAEDTRFPDQHFDMVCDTILFHEVNSPAARMIVAEAFRVLRPGGTFSHCDVGSAGNPAVPRDLTVSARANAWYMHRVNHERWWLEFLDSDFPGMLRDAGFEVDFSFGAIRGRPRLIATKPGTHQSIAADAPAQTVAGGNHQ